MNRLTPLNEITIIYIYNYKEHINTLCGEVSARTRRYL